MVAKSLQRQVSGKQIKLDNGTWLEFVFCDRSHGDLRDETAVQRLFAEHQPEYVVHSAARVAGISGNLAFPYKMLVDNLQINTNVINYCVLYKVRKVIAFSSICVFPHDCELMQEDKMQDGPIYPANFFYGVAKRAMDSMIQAAKIEHNITNYCSLIPSNIYGPEDRFCHKYGHIIPALIFKLKRAIDEDGVFEVFGDGSALREFLYIDDCAKTVLHLLKKQEIPDRLIVSSGKEDSIGEVVNILCELAKFDKSRIFWRKDKPNGQTSRKTDITRLKEVFPGFYPKSLADGLKETWNWYCKNQATARNSY